MDDWITGHKIPLGAWLRSGLDVLNDHAEGFFDFVSLVLGALINGLLVGLLWFNPLALIVILAVGTWFLHRSIALTIGVVLGLLLVMNLGYWQATMETLALVLCATLVSVAIGVPVGIAAAHRPWLYTVIRPILDLMQTIPTFVYLIPTLVLFGLGMVPGLISTVIFAIAAPVRLTHLGISSVPFATARGRARPSAPPSGSSCGRSRFPTRCRRSWPASPSASCCRCRWW